MDQTNGDTEGMQGDGVRDDAAQTADARAKAGEPTSRTSENALGAASDEGGTDGTDRTDDARGERDGA